MLPLGITLRETRVVMQLNWRDLLALAWMAFLAYALLRIGFMALELSFANSARENYAVFLIKREVLGLFSSFLLEFLLVGFYTLAVYRLMLLGESAAEPKFSDTWLRRYMTFLGATFQALAWPCIAFVPYALLVLLQLMWANGVTMPDFVPDVLVRAQWPANLIKIICAMAFYTCFARFAFVQPAAAVDVLYSPRESWRVTNWIWGHMLVITLLTVGLATGLVLGLMLIWPVPSGALQLVSIGLYIFVACGVWMMGITGFVVALSIAFCLRTGWRPGAQKLSLKRRPSKKK